MKRILVLMLVVGLMAGSVASAEAAKKKKKVKKPPAVEEPVKIERLVEAPYDCPCGVKLMGNGPGFILNDGRTGGAVVQTGAEDLYVTVDVKDKQGQKVFVRLTQGDTNGDGLNDTLADACNTSTEPLELPKPGAELEIFIFSGTCMDGTPALATGGVVNVTFSNMP